MSIFDMQGAIKRFGPYAGVRHLRNRGVPFEAAHFALFGCMPRFN